MLKRCLDFACSEDALIYILTLCGACPALGRLSALISRAARPTHPLNEVPHAQHAPGADHVPGRHAGARGAAAHEQEGGRRVPPTAGEVWEGPAPPIIFQGVLGTS